MHGYPVDVQDLCNNMDVHIHDVQTAASSAVTEVPTSNKRY